MNNKKLVAILALTGAVANLGLATAFAQSGNQDIGCADDSNNDVYTISHTLHAEADGADSGLLTALTFADRDINFATPAAVKSYAGTPATTVTAPFTNNDKLFVETKISAPADLTNTGCPLAADIEEDYVYTLSSTNLEYNTNGHLILVKAIDAASDNCTSSCNINTSPIEYTVSSITLVENQPQRPLHIEFAALSTTNNGAGITGYPYPAGTYTGTLTLSGTPVLS